MCYITRILVLPSSSLYIYALMKVVFDGPAQWPDGGAPMGVKRAKDKKKKKESVLLCVCVCESLSECVGVCYL